MHGCHVSNAGIKAVHCGVHVQIPAAFLLLAVSVRAAPLLSSGVVVCTPSEFSSPALCAAVIAS